MAIGVIARLAIIDAIAVAHVEARLGAIPPDRVLNVPRKQLRKPGIELPGINPGRHGRDDVGAAASLVAGRPIRMVGSELELAVTLERRAHSILGPMQVEPGCGLFPLAVETAHSFARDRIALVGEAAHVVPPIGAQGLNLGLRDAATLAEIVADARREGADVGSPGVMARYEIQRRADVTSRRIGIDLLNRSLLADFLPIQGVRGLSLFLVDRIGPLRRALMREGVAPAASQPRLMRGEMV